MTQIDKQMAQIDNSVCAICYNFAPTTPLNAAKQHSTMNYEL